MKNKKFKFPKKVEKKYSTLWTKLLAPVKKEALKYTDNIEKFQKVLENATKSKTFKKNARKIVKTIATMLEVEDAKNWREAARKSSRGKEIKEALEKEIEGNLKERMDELFEYNANLIETLPLEISKQVINHINSKAIKGDRAEDIAKEIKVYFPKRTKASAELIARTETSKYSSALTQARAEDLDLWWYVWRTSEDGAVRSSHKFMNGVLIHYKHPAQPENLDPKTKVKKVPLPYHAGNIYNCRCYQEPLTDYDDISFPHKVYNWKTGKVETMTLAQFKKFDEESKK